MRVVGRPAGPVRAPLLDLTADQEAELARLVAQAARMMEFTQPAALEQEGLNI